MILKRYYALAFSALFFLLSCGETKTSKTQVSNDSKNAKQLLHPDPESSKVPIVHQDLNKSFLPLQRSRVLAEPLLPFRQSQANPFDHE